MRRGPARGQDRRGKAPRSVRAYVAVAVIAGAGAVAGVVAAGRGDGFPRPGLWAAFLVLFVADQLSPLRVLYREESEAMDLQEAFLVAMSFVFPPVPVLLVFAVGLTVGNLARRLPPIKVAFNLGQLLAGAGAALLLIGAIDPAGDEQGRRLVAVLCGLALYIVINNLAVAGILHLADRVPLRRALTATLPTRGWLWVGTVSIGLLMGPVAALHPWGLAVGVAAIVALHGSLAAHVRAEREHARLDVLLAATSEAHATIGLHEVRQAILRSARDIAQCREARLDGEPPGAGELGVAMTNGPDGWLVVGGRRGTGQFDPDDRHMLEALAAIGSSALRNASLFEDRGRMLSRLVEAQEVERQRIASDIHDDSIQAVAAVGLRLGMLRRRLDDPGALAVLDDLQSTLEAAIARLRTLLFDLRPPSLDQEGLAASLRLSLERSFDGAGTAHELVDRLAEEPPTDARVNLYRICQEALANVRKHAAAARVEVVLEERDRGYVVRIRDDGRGFDPSASGLMAPGHLGLVSMRERAEAAGGWIRIDSRPGSGTTVEVWLPGTPVPVSA
ncbi:MAG: sensor histidine kinase [Actinobacteria bacterium]|nr:sensor histidine kinase [Actinomycetota bacterium]